MPVGFEIGLLHAYSLTCPATAQWIRAGFDSTLASPADCFGELIAVGQLL
jgi:hypothetical protein